MRVLGQACEFQVQTAHRDFRVDDEGRVVLLFVNSREKAEHLSTSLSTHLNEVALQRDIVDWSGSTDFYHSDMEDRKQKRLRTDFAKNHTTEKKAGWFTSRMPAATKEFDDNACFGYQR